MCLQLVVLPEVPGEFSCYGGPHEKIAGGEWGL